MTQEERKTKPIIIQYPNWSVQTQNTKLHLKEREVKLKGHNNTTNPNKYIAWHQRFKTLFR